MELLFWKKKKIRGPAKRRPRLRHETARHRQSQRRDDEILLKLDAIVTFLRKHDMDEKDRVDQLVVARRILRESNLDEIIKGKFSLGIKPKDIVKDLVSQGACSRATACRYVLRQSKLLKVSIKSH